MLQIFEAWGLFMPYVFILGILRIITDMVWKAFTRGEL